MEENTQAPTEGTEAPSWYYNAPSDDNEGTAGTGDAPEWFKTDKFKSVNEQAKSYGELEKRFGGFANAPEQYELPEGFKEDMLDGNILDIVKTIGKDSNMNQETFSNLVSKVAEYEQSNVEANREQALKDLGENGQTRLDDVSNWLNVNAPKDVIEAITPLISSAEAVNALEFFIDKSKGSKVADSSAQAPMKMSQEDYSNMLMATDSGGNLKMSTSPEYKVKMDELTLQMQR